MDKITADYTLAVTFKPQKEEYTLGELITVHIELQANRDFYLENIEFERNFIFRGKILPVRKDFFIKKSDFQQAFNVGQSIETELRFITQEPFSYNGYNLKIEQLCTISVHSSRTEQSLNFLGKSVEKVVKSKNAFEFPFFVSSTDENVEVRGETKEVPLTGFGTISFIAIFFFILLAILVFSDISSCSSIGLGFFTLLMGFFLFHSLRSRFYGAGSIGLNQIVLGPQDKDNFLLSFGKIPNHEKIREILVGYYLEEICIDNRGTSTTTINHKIFKYEHPNPLAVGKDEVTCLLPYPPKHWPPSLHIDGYNELRWSLNFKFIMHNGLEDVATVPFEFFAVPKNISPTKDHFRLDEA